MCYVTLCTVELKVSYIPQDFVSMFNAIDNKLLVEEVKNKTRQLKNVIVESLSWGKLQLQVAERKKGIIE